MSSSKTTANHVKNARKVESQEACLASSCRRPRSRSRGWRQVATLRVLWRLYGTTSVTKIPTNWLLGWVYTFSEADFVFPCSTIPNLEPEVQISPNCGPTWRPSALGASISSKKWCKFAIISCFPNFGPLTVITCLVSEVNSVTLCTKIQQASSYYSY